MKRVFLFFFAFVVLAVAGVQAQRLQHLGRGVVAVNNGSNVTITWRRLAQEPEDAKYNVYVNGAKLNASPLSVTNTTATYAKCGEGASVTVTSVVNGVESEASTPFVYGTVKLGGTTIKNAGFTVNYTQAGSPLPNDGSFVTKYCWPVDLDGDGEMEYVVNRGYTRKNQNGYEGWGDDKLGGDCLEAYTRQGQHLWTVNLGVHFFSCEGQNDGVCVGDFDGDGKGEVIVQLCEGARFWDAATKGLGKYLYYNGTQQHYNGSGTQTVSSDGSNPDIDGDKMTNYTYYSKGKNPQWYFAVIDGLTGAQRAVCAMTLPSDNSMTYTRANKSAFMQDEYSYLSPAMGAAYLDGVHQSAVGQFQCRTSAGAHHYFTYAYGYEGGVFKELWRFRFYDYSGLSEFHHIRIGDVDGDGKDEVMNGQCAVDNDGSLLWTSRISHGDRFRMSDIDPERPGQEIFAIQQNAPDMLGMILYDATDGSHIKKWYLPSVGDVGRGECMDVDPAHKGYEMWSTMENIYDCQGNQIGTTKPYPYEGIWWDGDLGRESLITSGSGNNCPAIVAKYNAGGWQRLWEFSKESGWQIAAENAVRPMFWGDILGDWREELILKTLSGGLETGFILLSTSTATSVKNIYCLLQDPNYYGQITNRGYYQSPNTSFYLGYDMPAPPLPPFMTADAQNEVFDLTQGNATITPNQGMKNVYVMPVKGQTLTIASPLSMTDAEASLWKSQQGALNITAPIAAAHLYISEGIVNANTTINAAIDLRARGTLAGSPIVGDTIVFEGALNYEGCRLMPQGTMTFKKGLTLRRRVFMEMQIGSGAGTHSLIHVDGNLDVNGTPIFYIKHEGKLEEGEYKLLEYTGEMIGQLSKFSVDGLVGLKYELTNHDNAIWLVVYGQREAAQNVEWTGAQSAVWDYQTSNWQLDGAATEFVAGDEVVFTDAPTVTTISMPDFFPAKKITFANDTRTYTFNGDGGWTGACDVEKTGSGKLVINTKNSDYEGTTTISDGSVTVAALADQGIESSLGSKGIIKLGKASLIINNASTSTDRSIQLTDSATVQVGSGTTALKGVVSGTGKLTKTGAGQLNINNSGNTWSGGTVLSAGTIAQGSWNAQIGRAGSIIEVTGNTTYKMFDSNSSSTIPNTNYVFDIKKGKTLTLYAGSRCAVNGSLRGEGTYSISLPYVRGDISTNTSAFEGTYDVLTSNCRFVANMDLSKATLKLEDGAYVAGFAAGKGDEKSYTHKVGSLTGSGGLGTSVWNVGYLGKNDTYSGVLGSAATLNKYGDGTLTLSGASAAPINIYAGVLVAGNTTAETTTGTITVRSGATLAGKGKTKTVSVQKDGILKPGGATGNTVGKLTLTGTLTMASGSVLELRTRVSSTGTCSNDQLIVSGTTKLTSPVIRVLQASGDYAEGQEFSVFTGEGAITLTGEPVFEPLQPAPGLLWDYSTLTTDGKLRIVLDPNYDGIISINDVKADAEIYDLGGRRVQKVQQPGIYVINGKKMLVK